MHLSRTGRRRLFAGSVAVGVAATLLAGMPGAGAKPPKPGPKPTVHAAPTQKQKVTQQQVSVANARKAALATKVGQISGQIAGLEAQLDGQRVAAQQAEQTVALRVQQQQAATDRWRTAQRIEATAEHQLIKARHDVDVAHARFVQFVQATYAAGEVNGGAGTLLTAADPTALLNQSALEQYQAAAKADAVGGMQRASVEQSNADAKARQAVADTKARKRDADNAKAAAVGAKQQADAAVASSEQQRSDLETQISQQKQQLVTAQTAYASTLHGYQDYQAYQQALSARQRSINDLHHWQVQAAAYRAYRSQMAALARARNSNKHHGGHHTSGGSTHISSGGSAPSNGGWTAAKGRRAVARARTLLGKPYIWAGGNAWGPTDGGCNDPVAPCGVVGYDCSGLVMYAWGRNWAHYAATQYSQAGSRHPSPGNFKPGDLLFWSENGTVGGIGHVAIYIGHGNVIQAPQSGDVVKITPWRYVENGYFGATRPLT